jgi:hypothetical protein
MMLSNVQEAVKDAVNLVNLHSGRTCVRLQFAGDAEPIDFVANAARMTEGRFEFQAGFETYRGLITELSDINAQLIQ